MKIRIVQVKNDHTHRHNVCLFHIGNMAKKQGEFYIHPLIIQCHANVIFSRKKNNTPSFWHAVFFFWKKMIIFWPKRKFEHYREEMWFWQFVVRNGYFRSTFFCNESLKSEILVGLKFINIKHNHIKCSKYCNAFCFSFVMYAVFTTVINKPTCVNSLPSL